MTCRRLRRCSLSRRVSRLRKPLLRQCLILYCSKLGDRELHPCALVVVGDAIQGAWIVLLINILWFTVPPDLWAEARDIVVLDNITLGIVCIAVVNLLIIHLVQCIRLLLLVVVVVVALHLVCHFITSGCLYNIHFFLFYYFKINKHHINMVNFNKNKSVK